jgi:hypothetical protein
MSPKEEERIRLAALLHDIGHLPFSHVGEEIMEIVTPEESNKKSHEAISVALIRGVDAISGVLDSPSGPGVEEVVALLEPRRGLIDAEESSFGASIISGQLDVDKMDYLLRDCHYTGVKYGIFDLDRLVNTVCKADRERRIAFEEGAALAIEQMILARFFMQEQVYLHKTRVLADAMAIRAATLAMECEPVAQRRFSFDEIMMNLDGYLSFDDESLTRSIVESTCADARDLMLGLRNRRLLHSVVKLTLDKEQMPSEDLRIGISGMSKSHQELRRVESEFAQELGFPPQRTIVNIQSMKAPTVPAPGGTIDVDDVLIKDEDGNIRPMSQFVRILRTQNEGSKRKEILYVHAPADNWEDRDHRKEIMKKSRETIIRILEGML